LAPNQTILFEFDDNQHHRKREDGRYRGKLKQIQKRDRMKNRLAKKAGLPVIRLRNIDGIASEQLAIFL